MDQADVELRDTVLKVWPYAAKEKIELLVPTAKGKKLNGKKIDHSKNWLWYF